VEKKGLVQVSDNRRVPIEKISATKVIAANPKSAEDFPAPAKARRALNFLKARS